MPKVSSVTIEKVQAAHRQMLQEEGSSSLRGVFERMGRTGSISIVSALYDVVVANEREVERFMQKALSREVHVAIHQEIERHIQTVIASLSAELATARESLRFLEDMLLQTNSRLETAEAELAERATEFEKRDRLAAELALKSEIALGAKAELVETIKGELTSTRRELETARVEALRMKGIERQLNAMSKELAAVTRLDERQNLNGHKTSTATDRSKKKPK